MSCVKGRDLAGQEHNAAMHKLRDRQHELRSHCMVSWQSTIDEGLCCTTLNLGPRP